MRRVAGVLLVVGIGLIIVSGSGAAAPVPECNGQAATIFGTDGDNNNLVGTPQRDVIAGLAGNDTIKGKGGRDVICGARPA